MGTGLNTHHQILPRLKNEKSYTFTPPSGLHGMLYDEPYLLSMSLPEFEARTSKCGVVAARGNFLSVIILKIS
jgi:hypothetical protein